MVEFLRDDQTSHFGLSLAQYLLLDSLQLAPLCGAYFAKKFLIKEPVNG